MLSQADAGPREYRRRGRTVNATHLPMVSTPRRRFPVGLTERFTTTAVTRGLDPRVHRFLRNNLPFSEEMDARVKPAHDSLL